ncbi:MAG: zinc ABC transporter substrate-binding protein [Desulfobacterales bacterium]|nr:zinc ABC transporter substrate-binding protein [Desulfobacterales bacterium]
MNRRLLLIVLLSVISFGSANAAEKLPVFVSIVPQKYFVQQIGSDLVDVKVMVKPGASPATYEPKPRQMAELSNSKLYFSIGVPFENAWLKKISAANPDMKVIHTDHGIDKIAMEAHHHHDEEHHGEEHHDGEHHDEKHHDKEHHAEEHHEEGHHGEEHHDHTGLDPHIWTSPALVKIQAETILKALQAADPSHKKAYEANFKAFVAKIDALDQELKQTLAGKKGLQFMVFHPAWGYFAKAYGLKQVPIEIEGKDPKPAQLKELIKHAKEEGIKVIFVQPQFSTKSAKTIASEIGGQVAFADPLAEDWMANLRMIAGKFKDALK